MGKDRGKYRHYDKRIHCLYQRLGYENKRTYVLDGNIEFDAYPCLYCGDPALDDDHTIPISYASKIVDMGMIDSLKDKCFIVPSCKACNRSLSDKVFPSLQERINYVKSILKAKYGSLRMLPEWTDEEIYELGYSLRDFIEKGEALRRRFEARVFWDYKEYR
jgi:hypothetical protein